MGHNGEDGQARIDDQHLDQFVQNALTPVTTENSSTRSTYILRARLRALTEKTSQGELTTSEAEEVSLIQNILASR